LGYDITFLPVGSDGIVDPELLRSTIKSDTILITVMHANNEVGSIQPIAEIGALAREHGVLFHTDAVQTFGHLDLDVETMNVDLLSLSAHKLYGPKGVGALYVRKESPLIPLIHGGAQEQGLRSSTHNVGGIVGLAKAVEIAEQEKHSENEIIASLRDNLKTTIFERISSVHLNGHEEARLPNNLNISIEGVEGDALVMNLDLLGISVSSGAACAAGSADPSHVLSAMGISPELARGSLRITLGRYTDKRETEKFVVELESVVNHLRSISSFV
jgi:cysteine desulfurase